MRYRISNYTTRTQNAVTVVWGDFTATIWQRLLNVLVPVLEKALSITVLALELLGAVLFVLFLYSCFTNWPGFIDFTVLGGKGF